MAAKSEPMLLTAAAFASLDNPHISGIEYRDELIEGERVLSPPPKSLHDQVIEKLVELLKPQFPEAKVIREQGWAFESETPRDNVPAPDVMVLAKADYERAAAANDWYRGCPLIVIEVISPSERRYRRMQKVGLYLEAGAGAVVEVFLQGRNALIYRPDMDLTEAIPRGHKIESPFRADLDELFRP